MGIFSISLAPKFDARTVSVTKDPKVINGYIEKRSDGSLVAAKRPGWQNVASAAYGSGTVQGITTYLDTPMMVKDNKLYISTSVSYTLVGSNGELMDFV